MPADHRGLIPVGGIRQRNGIETAGSVQQSVGGAERDRTADLLIANEALSQLSYGPNLGRRRKAVSGNELGAIYGPSGGESRMGRPGPACLACLGPAKRLVSPRFIRPSPAMRSILYVILLILDIYIWLLIAAAILSWLVAFNVVNSRNQFVAMIGDFLYRITEPVLRPIRNLLPSLGGIDVSPVVLILIIILIKDIIVRYIYPVVP
jgi:YggT family protein